MAQGSSVKKVPGGKLIRIDLDYSDRIEAVKITGDFFLHPEELLTEIEERLVGLAFPFRKDLLIQELEKILQSHEATLVGIRPEDIADTLEAALQ